MNARRLVLTVLALGLAATGCGSVATKPDASELADADPNAPDAPPPAIDAGIDASQVCGGGCDDADQCTTDACDTTTMACSHVVISCDDSDACTADSCAAASGCAHSPIAGTGAQTFNFTGAVQTFTVPTCVTQISIDAYGAAGGNGDGVAVGGLGGRAQVTITVTPNETLRVYVGGAGITVQASGAGGYNGGGATNLVATQAPSGTGGGASDVRRGTALTDRIVVAGGGGGGGWSSRNGIGGAGGGLNGGNGTSNDATYTAGGGGTQTAGGAVGWMNSSYPNQPGTFGAGGASWHDGAGCGGGGGGWYGGGTGGFAGGGGGSSFISAAGTTSASTQAGVNSGNGRVIISW